MNPNIMIDLEAHLVILMKILTLFLMVTLLLIGILINKNNSPVLTDGAVLIRYNESTNHFITNQTLSHVINRAVNTKLFS